jgi:hypothetical protein
MPMQPSDLELYTTKELVNELMRRKTFLGIVVHSEEELKSKAWTGERIFKVHYNSNLDAEQACRLLDAVSDYMDRRNS